MLRRVLLGIALAAIYWLWQAVPAHADGFIIPVPPPCEACTPVPPEELPYLAVKYHRVNVTIADQVATTRIDQVFVNDWGETIEGTYIFPLPESAAISKFTMWVDGKPLPGKLYTQEEARAIYDEIVRQRRDPALLEYIGRDLFRASIFPIPPGGERRVEIEYSQVLTAESGLVRYVYPLSTERFSSRPLQQVSVSVDIRSKESIKSVYSPSHEVAVERDGAYHVRAGWEAADVTPTTDFALYYTVSQQALGANLLSYKPEGEDGFFLLLVAPDVAAKAQQVVAKDVILVLDSSGSMEGEKLAQARAAATYILDHLNDNDRFNIISFSTAINAFARAPQPLGRRADARAFLAGISAVGDTDIDRALLEAMSGADRERPTIVIFLTDGLPTEGVTDPQQILDDVRQAAPKSVRLFPFGVGDDVDTLLLDNLARDLRGASAYVRPGERVDEQVSAFYAKVSTPILADVALSLSGTSISDIYPQPLPDLFAGSQLVVVGRYAAGGTVSLELTGTVNGEKRRFRYSDLALARSGGEDFIPRLWATRKVGRLLNDIRLHGESRELVDQVVKLSIRYGIITPYTSFLVEEPELALSDRGREQIAAGEAQALAAAPSQAAGSAAVSKAQAQAGLEGAQMAAPAPAAGSTSVASGSGGAAASVAVVGDKAFLLRAGVWTDTTVDPSTARPQVVVIGSPAFYDLIARYPQAAKYFALGDSVIVSLGGQVYQSQPVGATPTAAPIEALARSRAILHWLLRLLGMGK